LKFLPITAGSVATIAVPAGSITMVNWMSGFDLRGRSAC
jgi:hypothetical protein